ncbi:MAG: hypothetical protein U0174_08000 [Polyangiaceae bacterium]
MGLTEGDLREPGLGLQIGHEPLRIDVRTKISGLTFEEAWPNHIEAAFGEGVRCPVIGLQELLANKSAAGRLQDLADVEALEKIQTALREK